MREVSNCTPVRSTRVLILERDQDLVEIFLLENDDDYIDCVYHDRVVKLASAYVRHDGGISFFKALVLHVFSCCITVFFS